MSTQYSESEREATKAIVSMGRDPSNVVGADFGLRLSANEGSKPVPHGNSMKTGWFSLSLAGHPSLCSELVTQPIGAGLRTEPGVHLQG